MKTLILASSSPRRREIMEQVGLEFEVVPADGEEIRTREQPAELVEELSLQKAKQSEQKYQQEHTITKGTVFIGADTMVACGQEIMGKPRNEEDAVNMLLKLQGGTHQVYTGVTLIAFLESGRKEITFHEETDVTMYPMTIEQIKAYVATSEPMDKAGAYAVQGRSAVFIEKIDGDYYNVVGLPIGRLYQELLKLGIRE